ncbi:type IV pilin N-terminal domain-containing protein [Natrinema soli]|uniref:Type IV pilin N-terminal domain-containing protein n=1 Tax=Natrinema soli TaxID=1930624 RepID=A0ABD5SQI9_9EURY|nr:type IV pilin N-terminal domain-containing protein [Natrinema soli]
MIDGKSVRQKLIGSDDERAVSPVIGVILMVAITVILAAVIAAFVLDMGDNMGDEQVNAVVDVDVYEDGSGNEIEVSLTENSNADSFVVRGDVGSEQSLSLNEVGDSDTVSGSALSSDSGTVRIVAQTDGGAESMIKEVDFSGMDSS